MLWAPAGDSVATASAPAPLAEPVKPPAPVAQAVRHRPLVVQAPCRAAPAGRTIDDFDFDDFFGSLGVSDAPIPSATSTSQCNSRTADWDDLLGPCFPGLAAPTTATTAAAPDGRASG